MAVLTSVVRLAVDTKPTKLAVLTKPTRLAVDTKPTKLAVLTYAPAPAPPGVKPTIVEAYKIPTLKILITELGKKRYPLPVPNVKLLVVKLEVVRLLVKKF